jgi:hypothetical protein
MTFFHCICRFNDVPVSVWIWVLNLSSKYYVSVTEMRWPFPPYMSVQWRTSVSLNLGIESLSKILCFCDWNEMTFFHRICQFSNVPVSNTFQTLHCSTCSFQNMKALSFSFKFSPIGHGKTVTNALLHHAFPRRHSLLFAYDYRYEPVLMHAVRDYTKLGHRNHIDTTGSPKKRRQQMITTHL